MNQLRNSFFFVNGKITKKTRNYMPRMSLAKSKSAAPVGEASRTVKLH